MYLKINSLQNLTICLGIYYAYILNITIIIFYNNNITYSSLTSTFSLPQPLSYQRQEVEFWNHVGKMDSSIPERKKLLFNLRTGQITPELQIP